ncbi:MBL fold metallo-hydrolase [Candidatus Peregrinibacteria bacterium]|nr:MAG: MBL fold metallo-hydrolase [Candidatus Peregrinibacteria bacterium]
MDQGRIGYGLLVGTLGLAFWAAFAFIHPLTVTFLDVGQGDAILIQTPEQRAILIDTGPTGQVVTQLGNTLPFFKKKIDLFILTHPDLDHYGGLMDVIDHYQIERVALTGIAGGSAFYRETIQQLNARGVEWWFLSADQDLEISQGVVLDVLYPLPHQPLVGQAVKNKNDTSIAVRLLKQTPEAWQPLMTLTGDAEADQERELLRSGQALSAPILKAGHHGSRTSSTPEFVAAVQPKTVVISAGRDNSFGHPHPEVMDRFSGLEIRQTMNEGNITFSFSNE